MPNRVQILETGTIATKIEDGIVGAWYGWTCKLGYTYCVLFVPEDLIASGKRSKAHMIALED